MEAGCPQPVGRFHQRLTPQVEVKPQAEWSSRRLAPWEHGACRI